MVARVCEPVTECPPIRVADSGETAWFGHLPVTQRRLLSIMERAAAGADDFAVAERSLFAICEFRAAVVARELGMHWRSGCDERLHALIGICTAMGLAEVADLLMQVRGDLRGSLTAAQRRWRIKVLEEELLRLPLPIDQIIGRFAQAITASAAGWHPYSRQ